MAVRTRLLIWAPLFGAAILLALFALGLARPGSNLITSKMVGKPLPALVLRPATGQLPGIDSAALKGRPYLLNVFASWCLPCAVEAPQLAAIRAAGVPVIGIAIRDTPEDLARFLGRNGNPYARIGADPQGQAQIALGSSGVPESFVVGADGVIRLQHISDIRPDQVAEIVNAVRAAR